MQEINAKLKSSCLLTEWNNDVLKVKNDNDGLTHTQEALELRWHSFTECDTSSSSSAPEALGQQGSLHRTHSSILSVKTMKTNTEHYQCCSWLRSLTCKTAKDSPWNDSQCIIWELNLYSLSLQSTLDTDNPSMLVSLSKRMDAALIQCLSNAAVSILTGKWYSNFMAP